MSNRVSREEALKWPLRPLQRPRWLQHLIAIKGNYFWLPCPLCGRYFGGHEWDFNNCIIIDENRGQGFCSGHVRPKENNGKD